ncbi:biotin--[acetyl-CoA-carboxylase] ligase [Cellulomonas wangsupingiae]|uniref:biotin--[biotin carboxyl-carrier protein] ligase n=1 Tax=Cellulomonas wangsupingiae TaxID=2968085 RepID=A0ABY5K8K6_9CELL|nr:biotin--[acetyl-CoA-carboxylase] ligase [Cellulomonas wangsupingiae]MCC2334484.1 biotin--[acetyl-CoA-carboxylase] ligase [Cellulomonas wangsupingiae]MCM0640145.1 biotin--[acetyl-CoA-carboxylase] ligase [Cellulomonas wangsupingiae]UUI66144.1 biotin--[acetyl-CoA-carboxylase] ligase [Cellulomonas wangsupingiae]
MTERPPLEVSTLRELLLAPAGPLARLDVVQEVPSTNDAVVDGLQADPDAWPHASLLVAEHQGAGRGRAGRTWTTPPRAALTCTFVARPRSGPATYGWLPLLAGLGAVRALRATAGVPAELKWPNDVLVDLGDRVDPLPGWGTTRKVAGILAQAVAQVPAVAVGIGVNVDQRADELPVPWATSLALAGARAADRASVLVALVDALDEVAQRWVEHDGDAVAAGLVEEVASVCATVGRRVRVELPGGGLRVGTATGLAPDGALVLRDDAGDDHRVLAGDVTHVRVTDGTPA